LRGNDLLQRRFASFVVGRRVEREAEGRLLCDLKAREFEIEATELGVLEALQCLPATPHLLPGLYPCEVGTTVQQFGDEHLVVRFAEIPTGFRRARGCCREPPA
jgi:hypothetical protein